jgi:predicted RNA-binding protein with PUA-like domain
VLKKGNRLSITPVSTEHWQIILKQLDKPEFEE